MGLSLRKAASSARMGTANSPQAMQDIAMQDNNEMIFGAFRIPGPFFLVVAICCRQKVFAAFARPVNSRRRIHSQRVAHGTLRNPRKRARPPRTGAPLRA